MTGSKNDTNILELRAHPSHWSLLMDTHKSCEAPPPSLPSISSAPPLTHSRTLVPGSFSAPVPANVSSERNTHVDNHRILQRIGCVLNSLTPVSISPTVLRPHISKVTAWTPVIIRNCTTNEILNSLNKTLFFQVLHALIPIYRSSSRSPRTLNSLFPCQSLLSPLSSIP